MTMTIEKKLRDFHFWGGAAANAAKLTYDELDTLESQLESIRCDDEPWSNIEINDILRFQMEDICEWLGLDYEEVMARE